MGVGRLNQKVRSIKKYETKLKADIKDVFDDACKEYIKKYKTNIIQFDWDNSDAPAVVYSPEDDITDCYITKMEISVLEDGSVFVTCDLYAYYQQETYTNCELRDLSNYDPLDIAEYIISQIEYGQCVPEKDEE